MYPRNPLDMALIGYDEDTLMIAFSRLYHLKLSKAQGKLGNIVAETFVTHDVSSKFPCLPTRGNIVAETKFASWEAKIFQSNSETFHVSQA